MKVYCNGDVPCGKVHDRPCPPTLVVEVRKRRGWDCPNILTGHFDRADWGHFVDLSRMSILAFRLFLEEG